MEISKMNEAMHVFGHQILMGEQHDVSIYDEIQWILIIIVKKRMDIRFVVSKMMIQTLLP
jgi:hypothetical protein